MYKMFCVVARDSLKLMNGNRGKLCAQVGHAVLHAFWDAETRMPKPFFAEDDPVWVYRNNGKATKITLVVDTVDDLKALYDHYRPICGVSLVTDAGLTCFDGPTTTCLGIGPIAEDKVEENLQCLNVLI